MADDGVAGELTIGGRRRGFTVRLPRTPVAGRPVPLALVLHGNSPDAGGSLMREWTTFDEQADRWGWAIAYPDGHQGCWADGRGVTTADEAGVDDVAFLRALVDWSAEHHGTSPDRTVVAGISNGAFMAHRLALEACDRVAVMAAVAGGLPAALRDLRPTHAVSAMLIHGTADQITPIDGGYSRRRGPSGELRGRTLSLRETAEHWRAVDRCPPGPGETHTTEFSGRTTSEAGAGGTRVVAWTVFGGGHTWPGMPVPAEWDEPVTLEFDAAEEICRFAEPLLASADARRL
ncbi:alpha/beta hydrolase family esterase [Actinoallomurus iriomotensis]|uniref:Esterase n=1 Tax=Actinoallomurus iriomotensis TaxID=478107 RepID=A0A9W6W047_9ACTN|nr:PHB depolymerase family esterase [Actinoallomurus iriomotensis]GLY84531.1 esterase [Actinoallomurus iriomotensis]